MEVNASGVYLLAANGRDVVFRLLLPSPATKGESPGSSGRLRALGMSYSPTERLAGQWMRPPVTKPLAWRRARKRIKHLAPSLYITSSLPIPESKPIFNAILKVQTMATGLCYATKPRRFDLTMSRRTRRPANLVDNCHQDHDMEDPQLNVQQQQHQDAELKVLSECLCASPLQSQQSENAEERKMSQQSEDAEERKASQQSEDSKEQTPQQRLDEEEEEKTQQQHCQDNSRRLSLQELIDEANNGEKDAATGSKEERSAAAAVHEVAEAAAASVSVTYQPEHVAGRRMIGMMRRYVRVRSIKPKRAPEKNVAPVC